MRILPKSNTSHAWARALKAGRLCPHRRGLRDASAFAAQTNPDSIFLPYLRASLLLFLAGAAPPYIKTPQEALTFARFRQGL
jgi:hypothetical protein